jgi:HSP20 family molecular chaperone IbpA
MNRRNNRRNNNPKDIFGLEELLDAWMDMMAVIPMTVEAQQPMMARKPKHEGTMSYEERDKDIVFTIDMPGVQKKDIDIVIEEHSITVKSDANGRKYNYNRRFKPEVDANSAKATFTNGVLDITVQKNKTKKGKKVNIK